MSSSSAPAAPAQTAVPPPPPTTAAAAAASVVNPFGAVCGSSSQAFTVCVTSALSGFSSPETLCASQRTPGVAISPSTNSACLCGAATRITACYASSCPSDPTLPLADQSQQAYCKAAVAFGASVVTATANNNNSASATAFGTAPVSTTASRSAAAGSLVAGWMSAAAILAFFV
ncbi:hypothetical protein BJ741DRAFT_606451 [Chytriomyces cf. hyalinus JEL632]|nr:hypothetical protein BJ741DRAFT_606451 [Chytriomyces cf. hyalinus JEL632]